MGEVAVVCHTKTLCGWAINSLLKFGPWGSNKGFSEENTLAAVDGLMVGGKV